MSTRGRPVQWVLQNDPIGNTDHRTAPQPGAEADRYDPPLDRWRWEQAEDQDWRSFVEGGRARHGDEAFDRVVWHGGLAIDRRPLDPSAPPDRVPAGAGIVAWSYRWAPETPPLDLGSRLLFEDEGLLALDKPAWWTVQRTRASVHLALEDLLRRLRREPGLRAAHRLDRQTSGVVLFARSAGAARELQEAFAGRRVRKRYLAAVEGQPAWWACRSGGWWRREPGAGRFRFAIGSVPAPEARRAEARFRRLAVDTATALIEARPSSGRTHQLRVQLQALGHPLVGDVLYGAAPEGGRVRLHADGLELVWRGRRLSLSAPRPADLWPSPIDARPGGSRGS